MFDDSKQYKEVTCHFCGKKRTITYTIDYPKWERFAIREYNANDDGCTCIFGKLEKSKSEGKIKPMCMNCKYQKSSYCNNKDKLSKVSEMFEVGERLKIKDTSKKCDYWELDFMIFENCYKEVE